MSEQKTVDIVALTPEQRDALVHLLATELPMAKAEGAVAVLRAAPALKVPVSE